MKLRNLTKTLGMILAAILILTALPGTALRVSAAGPTPQAIWTEGDKTLTFIEDINKYEPNDTFNGQTVTAVWKDEEVTDTNDDLPLWVPEIYQAVQKVVFDASFADVKPKSLSGWFFQCRELTEIVGLKNLNTSEAVYLNGMFAYCTSLTSLDVTAFDLTSAKEIGGLFLGCESLKTLDLSGFDVSSVEYAEEVFYDCLELETIFCQNSDSIWQFSPDHEDEVIFDAENLLKLSGKYGSTTIPYNKSNNKADFAKSAKLGGYFTPKYMKVTFDANGGTGSMDAFDAESSFFNAAGTALPENTFAKQGFLFNGWNTKEDGTGTAYADKASIAPSEDLTLYAQWVEEGHEHQAGEAQKENEVEATCETEGSYELVVRCTGCNLELSRETVTVPALGHDWDEPTIFWQGFDQATAFRVCKRDNTHTESVPCTLTSEVTKEATETEDGVRTYTAKATFSDGTEVTGVETEVIPATGPSTQSWTWTRLEGSNRYATMQAITKEACQEAEEKTFKTLIVSTGESFPDALSGSALAGVYGCPIITTKSASLSAQAKSEIRRLAASDCTVLILGGETAVSKAVEDAIKALGLKTERVAGTTRVKTAIEVYKKGASAANGFSASDTVIITTGFNYADALSISPYAYASKTPILLTSKDGTITTEVKNLIKSAGFKKAVIVGGKNAVAEDTESYLKGQGLTVLRLEGSNRYVTSAQIMKWEMGLLTKAAFQPAVKMTNAGMGVATGENYPDALASAGLLGKTKSVLMLVSNTKSRGTIQKNIDELIKPYAESMGKGYIFGGENAVSKEIETLLNEAVK